MCVKIYLTCTESGWETITGFPVSQPSVIDTSIGISWRMPISVK